MSGQGQRRLKRCLYPAVLDAVHVEVAGVETFAVVPACGFQAATFQSAEGDGVHMGLADKLLAAGGVALVAAVVRNQRKEDQEEKRRRLSPLVFDPRLTESDFHVLVQDVALRTPRVEAAWVVGMTAKFRVASISGLSSWTAAIDFNDYGRLTGAYWLLQANADSLIPEHLADGLRAQIQSRMGAAAEAPAENPSGSPVKAESPALPETLPPAAWYPDPYRAARLQYWDGHTWTGHAAP